MSPRLGVLRSYRSAYSALGVVEQGVITEILGSEPIEEFTLDTLGMIRIREVLVKNLHPRLKKEVASSKHMPYGKTEDYIKYVQDADSEKLAKLIKTLALLLQTRVYLFWNNKN